MKIYNNPNLNHKHYNGVIAIGNFDGLHLGHQKVINEAKRKAKINKLPFGVMTFEPIPVMFFNKTPFIINNVSFLSSFFRCQECLEVTFHIFK